MRGIVSGFFVHIDLSIGLFFFSVYELKKSFDEALESLTHVEVGYVLGSWGLWLDDESISYG